MKVYGKWKQKSQLAEIGTLQLIYSQIFDTFLLGDMLQPRNKCSHICTKSKMAEMLTKPIIESSKLLFYILLQNQVWLGSMIWGKTPWSLICMIWSSGEVRVLCQGGAGGQVISDWTKMQDGRWKAAIWLDNNSSWQLGLWLNKNSRWRMEKKPSDWTIIQDGRWNRTGLNKMKFSDWPKFKFKFSLM